MWVVAAWLVVFVPLLGHAPRSSGEQIGSPPVHTGAPTDVGYGGRTGPKTEGKP